MADEETRVGAEESVAADGVTIDMIDVDKRIEKFYDTIEKNEPIYKLLAANDNLEGRLSLYVYAKTQDLSMLRVKLSRIIIRAEYSRLDWRKPSLKIDTARLIQLSEEIIDFFQREPDPTLYVEPYYSSVDDKGKRIKSNALRPLVNAVAFVKALFDLAELTQLLPHKKKPAKKKCRCTRLTVFPEIEGWDIITTYQVLETEVTIQLLNIDFGLMFNSRYPGDIECSKRLESHWPTISKQLIAVATARIPKSKNRRVRHKKDVTSNEAATNAQVDAHVDDAPVDDVPVDNVSVDDASANNATVDNANVDLAIYKSQNNLIINNHVIENDNRDLISEMGLEDGALRLTFKLYKKLDFSRAMVQTVIELFSDFIKEDYNPSSLDEVDGSLQGAVSDKVSEKITIVRIPLVIGLKRPLETEGLLEATMSYYEFLMQEKHLKMNLVQGKLWAKQIKNVERGVIVLPSVSYYDAIQIRNGLGSHAVEGNLGNCSSTIACSPPSFSSRLESMVVSDIFLESDRKKNRDEAIFKSFIEEVRYLRREGIELNLKGRKVRVHFILSSMTGDNLGLNSIFEYVCSFYNTHFCRICYVGGFEINYMVKEDESRLRTRNKYEEDLKLNKDPSETGLNGRSSFNDIEDFHVMKNAYLDLMHDLTKGTCNVEMSKILLLHLCDEEHRKFTINYLDTRMSTLDFGFESGNVPPKIRLDYLKKNEKSRMAASEMIFFTRYSSVLVGDDIPRDDKAYGLYPVIKTSVIRFESNNRQIKRAIQSSNWHKNTLKSTAIRLQLSNINSNSKPYETVYRSDGKIIKDSALIQLLYPTAIKKD
ncbi:hypothetical protein QAD02_021772 [Eretmocerus hayati]|uniref:Uncharacterized protein n=1 Tax=Eretmocerus hayati TaxID=131215 RepID=A0ACC2PRN0_9HYME|nr:hypothetical protein QAD02_021772 [Eretmocerus hayati]